MSADNRAMLRGFQTALRLIYPSRCVSCGDLVDSDFGLCGPCWRETPFIGGLVCDLCGTPLPGTTHDGIAVHCDDCMTIHRPWVQGRSALIYRGNARKLVLGLKHGDRTDICHPAAMWMAQAAKPLLAGDDILVPVPLHKWRYLRRRYNQAALLAKEISARLGVETIPDAVLRTGDKGSTDGLSFDERFQRLEGAMVLNPRQADRLTERNVIVVDDVMTSGATLAAVAEACHAAGAGRVCVLTLARVDKDA